MKLLKIIFFTFSALILNFGNEGFRTGTGTGTSDDQLTATDFG